MSKRHGAKGPAYRAAEKARKDEENAMSQLSRLTRRTCRPPHSRLML